MGRTLFKTAYDLTANAWMPPARFRVLFALAAHADDDTGDVCMSTEEAGRFAGISTPQAFACIRWLKGEGFLTVKEPGVRGRPNVYHLAGVWRTVKRLSWWADRDDVSEWQPAQAGE